VVDEEWDWNQWMVQLDKRNQVDHRSDLGVLEDGLNSQLGHIEVFTLFMNPFRPWFCVHSFIRSPIHTAGHLYASTLRLLNDGTLTYRLHDFKITFTPTTLMETLTSHHAGVCVLLRA